MDVLNHFPDKRLSELLDFLGFVGMYEDDNRLNMYYQWMEQNAGRFADALVVEAGAGFGAFTERALTLGARKVYAVEVNPHMARALRQKFRGRKEIAVVQKDVVDFKPREGRVDVLIQDLFGPLLYDESLYALERLPFEVGMVFPNQARLKMAVLKSEGLIDKVVTREVLNQLKGVLVGDLFTHHEGPYSHTVCSWSIEKGLVHHDVCLAGETGDVLVFALEIFHDDAFVCSAIDCTNWSLAWTPRAGDVFELTFKRRGIYCDPHFRWVG